ncbi:MAG: DeoR/GlpR transcriptional regulator [Parabacteroides sp.]|nr:DeoR/GlpR transcriptional regulator [Parabacteroides sp.]
MLKEERLNKILERISRDSRIYVTTLSAEFEVSDDTIRRDIVELEQRGLLTKVHGGAIARSGISIEFTERLNTDIEMKRQLVGKIIPLIKNDDVILIDGGTTNLELARALPLDKHYTVITNSLPIATELVSKHNIDVTMLGGTIIGSSQVTAGIMTYRALENIFPDWTIVGVSDIHPEKGLMTTIQEEAIIKRSFIEQGGNRVAIVTSNKLNTAHHYRFASLSEIDFLIVEDDRKDDILENWPHLHYTVL